MGGVRGLRLRAWGASYSAAAGILKKSFDSTKVAPRLERTPFFERGVKLTQPLPISGDNAATPFPDGCYVVHRLLATCPRLSSRLPQQCLCEKIE